MKDRKITEDIDMLIKRYPQLRVVRSSFETAYEIVEDTYTKGGKMMIAGNGGSAADSEHIAGELMKKFRKPRPIDPELAERLVNIDKIEGRLLAERLEKPLTAIPLVAHEALSTAYLNDVDGEGIFAQQLLGIGKKGDVFLAISTSGNSKNIVSAAIVAKAMDIKVVGLTGKNGGKLAEYADCTIKVPETETYLIQELHLPIYHTLCIMLENHFFS